MNKTDLTPLRLPKPARQLDPKFVAFVREQSCAICMQTGVDPNHMDTRGAGGSDYSCVPLCRVHHTEWHQLGDIEFTRRHRVNLWRINSHLLVEYFLNER